MATESPLLHDGSQTTAAANYSATANLAGMNSSGTTGSGSGQYLCVALNTTSRQSVLASSSGQQIYGILQNKPAAGQAADVGIFGVTKAVAGGSITAGDKLMAKNDGTVITWTSSGNKAQIGYAIETAASGAVFTMVLMGGTGNTVA